MNISQWAIRLHASLIVSLLAVGGSSFLSGELLPRSLSPRSLSWLATSKALAQASAVCLPPESDEYLLLVNQQTEAALGQIREVLPTGSSSVICRYLDGDVIRVGGFATEEVASAWGTYLAQTFDVQTAIVRPATPFAGSTPVTPPQAATDSSSTANVPAYNPQRLDAGYAVLVDYADRPDVAIAVQSLLDETIGVAVYRQTPYLLAAYSTDIGDTGAVLTQLVEAEFNAVLVDSSQVILMTPAIAVAP